MTKNLKKLLCTQFIIFIVVFCANLKSIAQTEQITTPDGKATVTITGEGADEEKTTEPPQAGETNQETETHSLAFEVLGRELTQREKENYGDGLGIDDLKNNILAREQKLAIVRALITLNSANSAKAVLDVYHISKVQTYSELIDYFSRLIERYGSVKEGIESEYVYNIKDDEQAFRKAAFKAYETVFGIPEDKQNKDQILAFLTQNNALTYSKMIQTLMQTITPAVKTQILFNALDQIGRPDLKTNDKFIKTILKQEFTYENLMELLKNLKQTAPTQPAKGKNLKIK